MDEKGYASGFEGVISYVDGLLPRNEHIGKAFRQAKPVYPEIAVRELIANALIHQDMTISGAGPMIEIYTDRIEVSNPGQPLIDVQRIIGATPRSRNELLSALMRRMNICEERGSGIVKVAVGVELYQLPAPDFRADNDNMKVTLFAPGKFKDLSASQRIQACYQHASLKYVSNQTMTNATLRERLGVEKRNAAQVSRIITDTLSKGLIRSADAKAPRAGYLPYWASPEYRA